MQHLRAHRDSENPEISSLLVPDSNARFTMNERLTAFCLLTALSVLSVTTLCVRSSQAADGQASKYYEDALIRFEKKDASGAIIQLKNALQQDPRMLAALLLIGKAYLKNAQPADAQDVFEKALKYGADPSEITLLLAQAMLDQGNAKGLLERFPVTSVPVEKRADLLVLRGMAHRQERDLAAAAKSFQEAQAVDPRSVPAMLGTAEIFMQRGKTAEALQWVDQALANAPDSANAWYLKALIRQLTGDKPGALPLYDKALELFPGLTDARVARSSVLLDLERTDAAAADIEYFKRENPKEPRGYYLRSIYLARKGDVAGAREALTEVTKLLDPAPAEALATKAPELLLLNGLAHHGLGDAQNTRLYLERFLRIQPGHVGAAKVLGSVLVERRDFVTAISVLEAAEKVSPRDPQLLALLASAYMGRGRNSLATRYLEQALALGDSSPGVRATLGFSLLKNGQQQAGVQQLQTAFDQDPSLENAGFALTTLYIRRGDTKQALEIADRLAQRFPSNVAVLNMLGIARRAAGDLKGARAAYEKAIQIDRAFTPAQLNLGKLDLQEKDEQSARKRFLGVLKDRPKDLQPMYELAILEDVGGRPLEAVRWLEKLRAIDARNLPGMLYLVDLYLRLNEPRKALEVAQGTEPAASENLDVQAAFGRALIANKDDKAAQIVFAKMTRLAGADPAAQYQVAQLQIRANNLQGAAYCLEKALEANPDYLPAKILMADIDLMRGQLDQAESRGKAIVGASPAEPGGYRLLGDVAMRRGRYAQAIEMYKSVLAKEPSTQNAIRLQLAYVRAGSTDKAADFMESWVKARPADWVAVRALAEGYLRAGNLVAARKHYESVLRAKGEDTDILNNLANILARQKDLAGAMAHAERAFQLAPTNPLAQDTLGWLLVQKGDLDAGLRHLREARLREPFNPEIRYHLAVALARTGRKDEARRELAEALGGGNKFEGAEDATDLVKELGG